MICGQLPLGGCLDPDIFHTGPCTPPGKSKAAKEKRREKEEKKAMKNSEAVG